MAGELLLGLVSSFYFAGFHEGHTYCTPTPCTSLPPGALLIPCTMCGTGFHEAIHGTAFASSWLAACVSHVAGFAIFRGANWYYYFHWHHHRFTNDPERDPELSGSTTDRIDPTADPASAAAACAPEPHTVHSPRRAPPLNAMLSNPVHHAWRRYVLFLSGFPFGFERLPGMVRHALGTPEPELWVDTPRKRRTVRLEYCCYVAAYAALAALAMARPAARTALWWYWLLPHVIGAGHLRWYQAAEHRGCAMGRFTDTSAWLVSRTTATWWLYCKLAWNSEPPPRATYE